MSTQKAYVHPCLSKPARSRGGPNSVHNRSTRGMLHLPRGTDASWCVCQRPSRPVLAQSESYADKAGRAPTHHPQLFVSTRTHQPRSDKTRLQLSLRTFQNKVSISFSPVIGSFRARKKAFGTAPWGATVVTPKSLPELECIWEHKQNSKHHHGCNFWSPRAAGSSKFWTGVSSGILRMAPFGPQGPSGGLFFGTQAKYRQCRFCWFSAGTVLSVCELSN